MSKRKSSKPTIKDMSIIMRAMMNQIDTISKRIKDMDIVLIDFIQYSSDLNKFEEWLDMKYKIKDEEE